MRRAWTFVLALAFGIFPDAFAQPYDPSLSFQTIETAHFLVHFHDDEGALARRIAGLAETAHEKLVVLLGHSPREKTHITVVDVDDAANGWAIAVPYNRIEVRAAPPDSRSALHQADDWMWNLIVHEYTHIIHTDAIGGPARILNTVFGKSLSPNAVWPRWFLEGLAVWTETELSTGGRLRSTLFDLPLRTQLLEDEPLSLQEITHLPLSYPRLSTRYVYGGRFIDFIIRKFGSEAIAGIIKTNGRSWVPYFLNTIAEQHTGLDFDVLYAAWLAEEKERALLLIRGANESEQRLTFHGETVRTPRASPDGKLIWSLVFDADSRPSLRALEVETGKERRVIEVNGDGALTVMKDGRVLLSQPEIIRTFRAYDDLFVFNPETSKLKRLTNGARLSEPDASSDGRIAAVRRPGPGRTQIVLFDAITSLTTPTVVHEEEATVASPRWSPDGTKLVFLQKRHGAFNLRLLNLKTGKKQWLTDDSSQDLNPAFDAAGRVLFSSDRSGTFDLYRLDLDTGNIVRLTRVEGGAFEALDIDGSIFYVRTGARGMDLAVLLEPLSEAAPAPLPPVDEPEHAQDVSYEVRPYSALDTLYPTQRLPSFGNDAEGYTLGLQLSGSDVLSKWRWAFSGWWGLASEQPGFSAYLQSNVLFPSLTLRAGRSISYTPGVVGATEVVTTGSLESAWSFQRWNSGARIALGWNVAQLTPRTSESAGTLRRGLLSTPYASVSWSNARRFTNSISNDEGRVLSLYLEGGGRLTGGDFSLLRVTASWNEYIGLPAHHALAFHASAGASSSDLGGRAGYALGGLPLLPSVQTLVSLQSNTRVLRGYPVASDAGSAFALGNLEWRIPLVVTEWGWSMLPVQLRRLHAAVFADVGDAFDPGTSYFTPRFGAGAELRAEVVLGYTVSTELKFGWARGLSDGGVNQFWVALGRGF